MTTLNDVLRNISLGAYVILALVTLRMFRQQRSASAGWAAATFGVLGVVAAIAPFTPKDDRLDQVGWQIFIKFLVAVLAAFPYFLYRFTASFRGRVPRIRMLANSLTAVVIITTFAIPHFPRQCLKGEVCPPRPGYFQAWLFVFLAQWIVLFTIVMVRLWRAGARQPTVARRRMRLLAFAAGGMNIAIIISAFTPQTQPDAVVTVSQSLGIITSGLFFLGFAPPRSLRLSWRQKESRAATLAINELMEASNVQEIGTKIVPHTAAIVGAQSSALVDQNGHVLGARGVTDEQIASALAHPSHDVITHSMKNGTLLVWTTAYMPFFGSDELDLLGTVGNLIDVSIDRCNAIARERDFLSNAAHELRTPIAALTGMAATLSSKRDRMSEEQVEQALGVLNRQGERARALVNSLLDLARAEQIDRKAPPQTIVLSDAVHRAVEASAPPDGQSVDVSIPDGIAALARPDHLERVLVNLLANAYNYGGRTIAVEATRSPRGVTLAVSDNGRGVSPEIVERLFEPFVRARDAGGSGSGLGLAISQRLVQTFGGNITYEKPASGPGARFVIHLRAAS